MIDPKNYKLIVEYDGTDFSGFQCQAGGIRTVQGDLEEALGKLGMNVWSFAAAGRTDTGVHALGQVVSFISHGSIPAHRMAIAINSMIQRDVSVARAEEIGSEFNARFSAKSRTYCYTIWTRRSRSAIWDRYAWHMRREIDIDKMRQAARLLVGQHDFASFAKTGGSPGPSTVRDVLRISIRRWGDDRIVFMVTANGFLRSMVRNIVSVLVEVGIGDMNTDAILTILNARDRTKNPIAPAAPHGLCLLRVDY